MSIYSIYIYTIFNIIVFLWHKYQKMKTDKADNYGIDKTDLKILEILMQDAKRPFTEVAKRVSVSQGTIHVRMNKLQEAGIVEKTTLKINYAKLGFDITAFIGIFLEKSALYEQVLA